MFKFTDSQGWISSSKWVEWSSRAWKDKYDVTKSRHQSSFLRDQTVSDLIKETLIRFHYSCDLRDYIVCLKISPRTFEQQFKPRRSPTLLVSVIILQLPSYLSKLINIKFKSKSYLQLVVLKKTCVLISKFKFFCNICMNSSDSVKELMGCIQQTNFVIIL